MNFEEDALFNIKIKSPFGAHWYKHDLRKAGGLMSAGHEVQRLRAIFDNQGVFRAEDLDTIRANSSLERMRISGSTYVRENPALFEICLTEMEDKIQRHTWRPVFWV